MSQFEVEAVLELVSEKNGSFSFLYVHSFRFVERQDTQHKALTLPLETKPLSYKKHPVLRLSGIAPRSQME